MFKKLSQLPVLISSLDPSTIKYVGGSYSKRRSRRSVVNETQLSSMSYHLHTLTNFHFFNNENKATLNNCNTHVMQKVLFAQFFHFLLIVCFFKPQIYRTFCTFKKFPLLYSLLFLTFYFYILYFCVKLHALSAC